MKKHFLTFAMLVSVTASATVTITPLGVDYNTKTVKFSVSWTGTAANNRVWVWVDLCPVAGTSPGTFAKAEIGNPAVVTGSILTVSGNTRGFYVTTNSSTVTATLSNATGKFNWCAYGSDFPPNAVENGSSYTLKGSPPFIITTSAGTTEVNDKSYSGYVLTALTDATGCPGVLCSKHGETAGLLGCCDGTTNCNGTCKTNGTYTTDDGTCTGTCNIAYVQLRNQCGDVQNPKANTYSNPGCTSGCVVPNTTAGCRTNCKNKHGWNNCISYASSLCTCAASCSDGAYAYIYRYDNGWYLNSAATIVNIRPAQCNC